MEQRQIGRYQGFPGFFRGQDISKKRAALEQLEEIAADLSPEAMAVED